MFILGASFGIYNMSRFKKYRTYSIMLFYSCAIVCLLSRTAYFVIRVIKPTTLLQIDLLLTVLPSYVSISMIASQLLTYILLIFNLNSYFEEKKNLPNFDALQSEAKLIQRQRLATVVMSCYIIVLPVAFLTQYFCIDMKLDESNLGVYY